MNNNSLEAYHNLEFVVDCHKIILTQLESSNDEKIIYSGPGQFYQEGEGEFNVKIFCQNEINPRYNILKINRLLQGEIIPDTELFSMEAYDMEGNTWISNSILPNLSGDIPNRKFIASGNFNKLFLKKKLDKQRDENMLKLFFKGKFSVPINSRRISKEFINNEERGCSINNDVVQFTFLDFDIEIHVCEEWTIFCVFTEKSIDYKFIQRISESFHFVMGITQPWSIAEVYHAEKYEEILQAFVLDKSKTRIGPPIELKKRSMTESYWKLFLKFYSFTSSHENDEWHPIYELIYKVFESGKASLEASILTTTVAVEGLSKLFDYEKDNSDLKEEIKKIQRAIKLCELNETLENRVSGMINSMQQVRAIDILYDLSKRGVIDEKLVASWKRLRNKSAHSTSLSLNKIQQHLNDLNCRVPCDNIPERSWPLFLARDTIKTLLSEQKLPGLPS